MIIRVNILVIILLDWDATLHPVPIDSLHLSSSLAMADVQGTRWKHAVVAALDTAAFIQSQVEEIRLVVVTH